MKNRILAFMLFFTLIVSAQEKTAFSLNEAIDYALENGYAIKNAKNDLEAAKKEVWITTTIGLPQVNANVDYQNFLKQPITLADFDDDGVNEQFVFGTKQNINATVTLTQLLFDGSYLVGLQSAKTYLKISEGAKEKTDFAVKEAVVNAYANVLLTEENILILEKNKFVLEKNLKETLEIIKNGFSEEQDGEQLQLTLASINNELNKVNRLQKTAYKMLNIALGIDVDKNINLTDNLESLLITNLDLKLTQTDFDVKNHIDYEISETNRKAKELLVKYEKSKYLPSLNAFVNYGTAANNDKFAFFKSDQKWFGSSILGVSLNVPIFSSFEKRAKTQQAKINLEKADIELTETEQNLKVALQSAQSDYQYAIDSYQTSKGSLNLAERIEKKESIKFFEGISTSFDLSNAQNQLYTKQQEYLQSIFQLITSKSTLENALNIK